MAPYPFKIQRDIIITCFAIHNFTRKHNIEDKLFAQYDNTRWRNGTKWRKWAIESRWTAMGAQGIQFMANSHEQIANQLFAAIWKYIVLFVWLNSYVMLLFYQTWYILFSNTIASYYTLLVILLKWIV